MKSEGVLGAVSRRMRATGSTSHDSDACVIHGNWVFGNMGLQSGVMVSSRRISRACSRAKYQGKRRRLQALRPVHHNLAWGQASARRRSLISPRAKRISYFRENVAMLPRETICSHFFFFCKRSWSKWRTDCRGVCALGVTRAQADAPQFVMGARFGEAALVNASKGKAYLIIL